MRPHAALVLAITVAPISARAAASRLLLATPDPALGSALRAAFAPRGVEVIEAPQPLRDAADLPQAGPAESVVWLCEAAGSAALCLRHDNQTVVVRQVAMAQPLSPADAAALALSVEVALLHPAPPPPQPPPPAPPAAQIATPAPAPAPETLAPFAFTLEVMAGVGSAPVAHGGRAGVAAVYAPASLGRRIGLGLGVLSSSSQSYDGEWGQPLTLEPRNHGSHGDVAWRFFARARAPFGPLWLHVDAGPSVHVVTFSDIDSTSRAVALGADVAVGAVVELGRFFAGARLGTSWLVTEGSARLVPASPRWGTEVLLNVGVGFR